MAASRLRLVLFWSTRVPHLSGTGRPNFVNPAPAKVRSASLPLLFGALLPVPFPFHFQLSKFRSQLQFEPVFTGQQRVSDMHSEV